VISKYCTKGFSQPVIYTALECVQCCMRGVDCGKRRRPRVIIMMGVIYEED